MSELKFIEGSRAWVSGSWAVGSGTYCGGCGRKWIREILDILCDYLLTGVR